MLFNLSFVIAFITSFAPFHPLILVTESVLAIIFGAVTAIVMVAVSKFERFIFSFRR
ncbi:hypothetical protein D3C84_640020 [compost metagenome]